MGYKVSIDDLKSLYRTGKVLLPTGAKQYAQVATAVNATARGQGSTFGGKLGTSPVQAQWTAFRDLFQDQIVIRTYNAIVESGDVLAKIANDYGENDEKNHDDLEDYRKELDNKKDENGDPVIPSWDKDKVVPSGNENTDPSKPLPDDPDAGNPDPSKKPEKPDHDGVPKDIGGHTPMPQVPPDVKDEDDDDPDFGNTD